MTPASHELASVFLSLAQALRGPGQQRSGQGGLPPAYIQGSGRPGGSCLWQVPLSVGPRETGHCPGQQSLRGEPSPAPPGALQHHSSFSGHEYPVVESGHSLPEVSIRFHRCKGLGPLFRGLSPVQATCTFDQLAVNWRFPWPLSRVMLRGALSLHLLVWYKGDRSGTPDGRDA